MDKQKPAKRKQFRASRLGLYIVVVGWLAFLVTISQSFLWTNFDSFFDSMFVFDIDTLPFKAMALAIPLILSIIGFMVYQREQFLGHVIATGRKLESKNVSLETSYKKLYGKMKEGAAGSAHTVLLEDSRLLARGANLVMNDLMEFRASHPISEAAAQAAREDLYRFKSIAILQEALGKCNEPGKVQPGMYLKAVCRELIDSYGIKVRLDIDAKAKGMAINTLFPCGIIVCELVMNSLKHAFEGVEDPVIAITLITDAKGASVLKVSDNGNGFPEDLDMKSISTVGLKMMHRMTRVMKAQAMREEGIQGTAYSIKFNV